MTGPCDIAIIGAGAAGLFAAIWAGRKAAPGTRIIALDGAKKLGAKILVAGGGRCNVTHYQVDEQQYAGSSPNAIRKVLRSFDVPQTVAFFEELGVTLKREETGKLFPTTDDANTILNALHRAASNARVELINPWRVASINRTQDGFVIERDQHTQPSTPRTSAPYAHSAVDAFTCITARRIILATGGRALPLTGSDGKGYEFARSLGHTTTDRIFPALVPLTIPKDHPLTTLSGLTRNCTLELRASTGKKLKSFTNSTLLTHFGLSGPSVLDISRYHTAAKIDDPGAQLVISFLPGATHDQLDAALVAARTSRLSLARWLTELPLLGDEPLPERLARVLCTLAGVDAAQPVSQLSKDHRRALVTACAALPLPITGDRGYTYCEVTAGGVPLSEVNLATMESRVCPGLHLCGEILDVDGRIGGFNFQWAWASGYLAGRGTSAALQEA
ncbi:MAG TPA: aminoacetone oxidase family FAD-binding enzyme [Phycisphaerales bacterium]|nr:aminoacetone oxidase family FAD-binding enzyme [Phycisphaerales bacterium]